ncbi:MAG: thiamine phosphate synthase [Anaerococcus sp.]|jgi:thiamine-phosphate pyrophosphorylase|nr:thiamine phosphate synthase [Peptoniphilaceae bacterium]MDY3054915.1 thiamine phosphate synthase [Anaerococcus sp.]
MKDIDLTLYLVTNRDKISDDVFFNRVEEALEGGVSLVQLREKTASTREMIEIATKLKDLCHKYQVPLLIDDRVDVCLASGADGVHLGSEDMDIDVARRILGDEKIIGATAKTVETALEKERQGADYLGVGAIYPTKTKVKTVLTKVSTLRAINDEIKIPSAAIGGLNETNLDVLEGSGASGICVVRAIMDSEKPREVAEKLSGLSKEILNLA